MNNEIYNSDKPIGTGSYEYKAFYLGKHVPVMADTLLAAKETAVEYFKPSRARKHMVAVVLVGKADSTVIPLDPASL